MIFELDFAIFQTQKNLKNTQLSAIKVLDEAHKISQKNSLVDEANDLLMEAQFAKIEIFIVELALS